MPPQPPHQLIVDAQLHPLHVNAVHQELVAVGREHRHRGLVHLEVRPLLPPIRDDVVVVALLPAGEIQHQPLLADSLDDGVQPLLVHRAVAEDVGGDDDVASPGVDERHRRLSGDPAAHLEPAREGAHGVHRRLGGPVVAAQHDDVPAEDAVALVHLCELRAGSLRLEVGLRGLRVRLAVRRVLQRAAHDLLHPSLMDVDARAKLHCA